MERWCSRLVVHQVREAQRLTLRPAPTQVAPVERALPAGHRTACKTGGFLHVGIEMNRCPPIKVDSKVALRLVKGALG